MTSEGEHQVEPECFPRLAQGRHVFLDQIDQGLLGFERMRSVVGRGVCPEPGAQMRPELRRHGRRERAVLALVEGIPEEILPVLMVQGLEGGLFRQCEGLFRRVDPQEADAEVVRHLRMRGDRVAVRDLALGSPGPIAIQPKADDAEGQILERTASHRVDHVSHDAPPS
jgi:hypothetical protein